jgi:hypothetical protein
MAPSSSRWLAIGASVAIAALVAAGCGSSSSSGGVSGGGGGSTAPGVTATSITFGTHQPLTGPVAPGYSEIAPASAAFFNYVNAHGGVFGRKIRLIIKDDAYNPTNTVNVTHQLVLQNKVFGIFEGLGTPTHTKVVGYLDASKVPDVFVASGCPCWDDGSKQPYTFGWQPNYTIQGKILGQYIKQHFAGQKVGVLYQDDDFGRGGLAGIQAEMPGVQVSWRDLREDAQFVHECPANTPVSEAILLARPVPKTGAFRPCSRPGGLQHLPAACWGLKRCLVGLPPVENPQQIRAFDVPPGDLHPDAGVTDRLQAVLPAGDDHTGRAGDRAEGLQGHGGGQLHGADLHRDQPAHLVHARLQAAAGRVERGHRPDHGGRAAQVGVQGVPVLLRRELFRCRR